MSKRKQKKLQSLLNRIRILKLKDESTKSELNRLSMQAAMLSAQIACDAMPPWKRNALVHSSSPTNLAPRPPVNNSIE
jgi:hypothetical protein